MTQRTGAVARPMTSLPGLSWQNMIQNDSELGTFQENIHRILVQHVSLRMYTCIEGYCDVIAGASIDRQARGLLWLRHWRMTHAYSCTEQGWPSEVNGQPRILLRLALLYWRQTYEYTTECEIHVPPQSFAAESPSIFLHSRVYTTPSVVIILKKIPHFLLQTNDIQANSTHWVCERTIPTERPTLVGEISANFCG
jgi:hypothetical protein